MNWSLVIAIVVLLTAMDVVIIWAIVRFGWGPLPRAFPARDPLADAVSRKHQSFRINLLSFGFCINVAVDEQHLHLTPIKPLRAIGAKGSSIPWESIRIEKRPTRGRWLKAKAGSHTIRGPAWCLELAGGQRL